MSADTSAVWAEMQAVLAKADCGPFPQLTEDYAAEVYGGASSVPKFASLECKRVF